MQRTKTTRELSQRLVAGLDFARALAACYVVVHHVANSRGWSHGLGLMFRFGQEAVLVFFLLSGFVIFANERDRAIHLRGYYLRRLRRIYPALVAALIISTLIAFDNGVLKVQYRSDQLLGTLLGLQDISVLKPGVIVDPYLNNSPLWSLSYEVFFYLIFPLVLRLWLHYPKLTNHAVGTTCCAAYLLYVKMPNHWALVTAYYLVWWCGAMAADGYLRSARDFRSVGAPMFWLAVLCVIATGAVLTVGYRGLGIYPFLPLRHFIAAIMMLIILFGRLGAGLASISFTLAMPAAFVASFSYGLYVLHVPLLVQWHRAQSDFGLAAAVVLMVVIAYFSDRQLSLWLPKVVHR